MIRNSNSTIWLTLLMAFAFAPNVPAYGDSFSCSYGKKAACLDYGDKVCSSLAKCVSNDAVCFNSYTCDYNGFICKSEYNDLLSKCKNISTEHDDLVDEYNNLLRKYKIVVSEYEDLQSCVSYASTLDEARDCY